jgi:hypothetical protein
MLVMAISQVSASERQSMLKIASPEADVRGI